MMVFLLEIHLFTFCNVNLEMCLFSVPEACLCNKACSTRLYLHSVDIVGYLVALLAFMLIVHLCIFSFVDGKKGNNFKSIK